MERQWGAASRVGPSIITSALILRGGGKKIEERQKTDANIN